MENLDAFRQSTRAWLAENYPASLRERPAEAVWGGLDAGSASPDVKLWLDRMIEKGWTAPTWPTKYGGGGLSNAQARVLSEEMARVRARPPLASFGLSMLGPVLLEFANEEQKQEHIPKIVRGEIRWCQGYSEPGAGSDLASLQTRAEDKGDHYLVNGQKIWTSGADTADWIFCLVRTDPDVPKHDGISFLLFDMKSEGVSVAPIKLISGSSPFCQTFFENVKVPKRNLVGRVTGGWTIAKRLLQHERSMIGGGMGGGRAAGPGIGLPELASEYLGKRDGKLADPLIRDRIAQHMMDQACFSATARRSAAEAKAGQGQGPGAASSMFKYYGTELNKRRYELLVSILGTQAFGWEGEGFSQRELSTTREWLRSKGNSIEGGTSEIQLNVVAKRVLGLPD
ncbi:MAG: acyl-CoA dehydrogenase family protein [Myxococcota bacterium]